MTSSVWAPTALLLLVGIPALTQAGTFRQEMAMPRMSGVPVKAPLQPSCAESAPAVTNRQVLSQVESALGTTLQRTVDRQRRIEGQRQTVSVDAWFNHAGTVFNINLSDEYRPRWYGAELEDLLHELATIVEEDLRSRGMNARVKFTIAGQDLYELFPEQRPADHGGLATR